MTIRGIPVLVVRKEIKHLHLGVYPPSGRVRVAAPDRVSDNAVRLAVVSRLGWIRRRRRQFQEQERQTRREMVSGESHYVFGRRYRLHVIRPGRREAVRLRAGGVLELSVRADASQTQRQSLLARWYRTELRQLMPALLEKWQPRIGVRASDWGIRRMKTKWGSCSRQLDRIWVNLELAKKPRQCLEYIVVHELVHLLERRHNERFMTLMDRHMPRWRQRRDELNAAPLAHEKWNY